MKYNKKLFVTFSLLGNLKRAWPTVVQTLPGIAILPGKLHEHKAVDGLRQDSFRIQMGKVDLAITSRWNRNEAELLLIAVYTSPATLQNQLEFCNTIHDAFASREPVGELRYYAPGLIGWKNLSNEQIMALISRSHLSR